MIVYHIDLHHGPPARRTAGDVERQAAASRLHGLDSNKPGAPSTVRERRQRLAPGSGQREPRDGEVERSLVRNDAIRQAVLEAERLKAEIALREAKLVPERRVADLPSASSKILLSSTRADSDRAGLSSRSLEKAAPRERPRAAMATSTPLTKREPRRPGSLLRIRRFEFSTVCILRYRAASRIVRADKLLDNTDMRLDVPPAPFYRGKIFFEGLGLPLRIIHVERIPSSPRTATTSPSSSSSTRSAPHARRRKAPVSGRATSSSYRAASEDRLRRHARPFVRQRRLRRRGTARRSARRENRARAAGQARLSRAPLVLPPIGLGTREALALVNRIDRNSSGRKSAANSWRRRPSFCSGPSLRERESGKGWTESRRRRRA